MKIAGSWLGVNLRRGEVIVGVRVLGQANRVIKPAFRYQPLPSFMHILARLCDGEELIYDPSLKLSLDIIEKMLSRLNKDLGTDFQLVARQIKKNRKPRVLLVGG
ncbi:MAG: hypothetical protein WD187_00465 [Candidatus Woykebacteria bacterium]